MYYGVQYYRAPFPRKEFWENDLKKIKELGFNTIKLWAVWNDIEREEGKFTFNDLDQLVELATQYELKVIINMVPEGAPYWLYELYPECLYETVNGDKILPGGPANIPTAGWPGLCMDDSNVNKLVCRFIKETAAHYRNQENVIIIDVWNEPHLEPMYDYPDELLCSCSASKKEFIKWLKKRYIKLENLNRKWYRTYTEWEQITPPPRFGTYPDMIDWRRFWLFNLRRWLVEKVKAAKEGAPNKIMQTHVASSGYLGASGNGALGVELADEFLLAETVELFGLSSFPAWLMGTTQKEYFLAHMMSLDVICSASREKTFYQVELQGGAGKPGILGHKIPNADDIRVWNWNVIAAGGKGVIYWQYAFEPSGMESPGFGLTGFEHEDTERSQEAGRCARYFLAQRLDETIPVQSVNGICISRNTALFLFSAGKKEKLYADSLSGIYRVCAEEGIPVRFVHTSDLWKAWDEGLQVLYVPMAVALSEEEQKDLLAFANEGGRVVFEAATGVYDECGEMNVYNSILKQVFGAYNFGISYYEDEKIVDENGQIVCENAPYIQTMQISKGRILGKTTKGNPAYAEIVHGKGVIRWIGTYPAMMCKTGDCAVNVGFISNTFIKKGYKELEELDAKGLIVRMLKEENQYKLIVVNQECDRKNIRVKFREKIIEKVVERYDGILLSLD